PSAEEPRGIAQGATRVFRTAVSPEAGEPAWAGSRAPLQASCRGSSRAPPVLDIPAAEGLLRRLRNLALAAPRVKPIVDGEAREMLDREASRRDGRAIKPRVGQHLACDAHHFFFHKWKLVAFGDDLPPFVDLLVNIDLDRADIGAACIQRRSEREVAVFADIECGIDDDADRTRVRRAITQPSASAVDRAGIHARSTPDAFQRIPEIAHAEALRASIVDEHDVELAAIAWCSKVRRVLCDRRA